MRKPRETQKAIVWAGEIKTLDAAVREFTNLGQRHGDGGSKRAGGGWVVLGDPGDRLIKVTPGGGR